MNVLISLSWIINREDSNVHITWMSAWFRNSGLLTSVRHTSSASARRRYCHRLSDLSRGPRLHRRRRRFHLQQNINVFETALCTYSQGRLKNGGGPRLIPIKGPPISLIYSKYFIQRQILNIWKNKNSVVLFCPKMLLK